MGAIEGIVRNFKDVPLEEISIIIMAGPSRHDIASITDVTGNFAISNLRPGHYIIKAFGKSESEDIPVQVINNQTAFVEIWLKTDQNLDDTDGNDNDSDDDNEEVIGEVKFFEDNPSGGLLATKWKVKSIKPHGALKPLSAPGKYLLDFDVNNTYHFNTDVNSCEGNFMIENGGKIRVKGISCTEAGGDSHFADNFRHLLPLMSRYEIRDNLLILKGDGEITLTRYIN